MGCVAEVFGIPSDEIQEEDLALLDDFNRSLRTVLILPTLPPNSFLDKARSQRTALEYQAKVRKREGK